MFYEIIQLKIKRILIKNRYHFGLRIQRIKKKKKFNEICIVRIKNN